MQIGAATKRAAIKAFARDCRVFICSEYSLFFPMSNHTNQARRLPFYLQKKKKKKKNSSGDQTDREQRGGPHPIHANTTIQKVVVPF